MTLQVSARATEIDPTTGISSGGGAAQNTKRRKVQDPVFERSLWPNGTDASAFGVSLASLLSVERPVEQQARAIDARTEMIESSRRQSSDDAAGRDAAPAGEESRSVGRASEQEGRDGHRPASPTDRAAAGSGQSDSTEAGASPLAEQGGEIRVSKTGVASGREGIDPLQRADAYQTHGPRSSGPGVVTAPSLGQAELPARLEPIASISPSGVKAAVSNAPITQAAQSGPATGGDQGLGRDGLARLVSIGRASRAGNEPGRGASPFTVEQEATPGAQVARGLAHVLKGNGGTVTLRLRPEHLGEVRATVRIEQGSVSVTIRASGEEARALLEREAGSLRAALEARGLGVEHIRVEAASRSDQPVNATEERHAERGVQHEGGDRPSAEDRREQDRDTQESGSRSAEARTSRSDVSGVWRQEPGAGQWASAQVVLREETHGVLRLDATA